MNIKKLQLFVAIVTSCSFSKGAEAACITQSTASQHIATLEDFCGVRLLDRTGRGFSLARLARFCFFHAQRVMKALQGTEQALFRFRQAEGV